MNIAEINDLIKHPRHVNAGHAPELGQLANEYPWCQTFQMLSAKSLKAADHPAFQQSLRKTAIYAADRKILYRLIMQPGVQQAIAEFEGLTSESQTKVDSEVFTNAPHIDSLQADDVPAEPVRPENEAPIEPENINSEPENDLLLSEEDSPLDASNLEKEVLKEVAALAYQRELEAEIQLSGALRDESSEEKTDKTFSTESETEKAKDSNTGETNIPASFIDFITGGKSTLIPARADIEKTIEPVEEDRLIDRFIKNEPKIERKKASFFSPVNMGKMSLVDNNEIVTETLASIYAKQGDVEKAKRAYEQLSLKYPEKSLYFAGLIEKLAESKFKK